LQLLYERDKSGAVVATDGWKTSFSNGAGEYYMYLFKINQTGARHAVPEWWKVERRFAVFHGGEGFQSWKYCLRLSQRDFPEDGAHDWAHMSFRLLSSRPPQRDEMGNNLFVLKRGEKDGKCIIFLDMEPGVGGTGVFHSWNEQVSVLGHGMEVRPAPQNGHKGARRAIEIDYPVLVCKPGAQFSWERSGVGIGGVDYTAEWDGVVWNVWAEAPRFPAHSSKGMQRGIRL
jgi:hypothetical protein